MQNEIGAIIIDFDKQYSLIQTQNELRKIIINLSSLLLNPDTDNKQRQDIFAQIKVCDGMSDMLHKVISLSFPQ